MFFIIEKSEKATLEFSQNAVTVFWFILALDYILNWNSKDCKFIKWHWQWIFKIATRKWYVINDQDNTEYGEGNGNDSSIKFETKVIISSLCDYSDAYILVTANITATGGNGNTKVAFKNCALFTRCVTRTNDEHIDASENVDIIMPM